MRKTIQKYREKKEIKDYFSFVSSYMPNLQVIIKKNKTDDILHIYLNNGVLTINQIYFNKEDAKKIIKALQEMIEE
jgi:hypothetical protein